MESHYPSLREILARTRLKVPDLPGQKWANRLLGVGIALTLLTFVLAGPAFFSPAWKAFVVKFVIWVYGASLLFNGAAVFLLVASLAVGLLRAADIQAGQFDQQHVDEQALAASLAATHAQQPLERTAARLQLEIDLIENTKALAAALGGLVGSLTPVAALLVRQGALTWKPEDLALLPAALGVAVGLILTLRFRDHLVRARHVVQEALLKLPAG